MISFFWNFEGNFEEKFIAMYNIIKDYIENSVTINITNKEIKKDSFLKKDYNKKIRDNIDEKHGVYIWYADGKIIYIGKGGSINVNGEKKEHNLCKRLIASRGKDKNNNKDIQTKKYIKNIIESDEVKNFEIKVFYTKNDIPAGYVECLLLFEFYKKQKKLPKYNKSF